jgi:PAS domain S-box-containing protein
MLENRTLSEKIGIFPWIKEFETGIKLLDDWHCRIALLVNRLADCYIRKSSEPCAVSILSDLVRDIQAHFQEERNLWSEMSERVEVDNIIPGQHSFDEPMEQILSDSHIMTEKIERLLPFLTRWLIRHILVDNKRMLRIIDALKEGVSIQEAVEAVDKAAEETQPLSTGSFLILYDRIVQEVLCSVQEKQRFLKTEEDLKQDASPGKSIPHVVTPEEVTEKLTKQEKKAVEFDRRSERQRTAIIQLATDPVVLSGKIPGALRRITEYVSKAVAVAQVGIWMFSEDGSELYCLSQYEALKNEHFEGFSINKNDYPNYFKAMFDERHVSVEDIGSDFRTSELAGRYAKENGIVSMLDAGITKEGKLIGVVCLEHKGQIRKWHSDEEAFATTAASMVGQILAVIERKHAEEALRESEANLKAILENTSESVWSVDTNYRVIYTNPVFTNEIEQGFGVSLTKGTDIVASAPDHLRALWKKRYDSVMQKQSLHFIDMIESDFPVHTVIYADISMNPIVIEDKVIGVAAFSKNITVQEKAKIALEETEKRYRKILELAPVGIAVYQNDQFIYINPAAIRLLGADSLEQLSERNIRTLINPDHIERFRAAISQIEDSRERSTPFEVQLLRLDGTSLEAELSVSFLTLNEKTAVQVIATDITERKQAEKDRIARKAAEEASRAKSAFLSNMSHEIRTPLNAIIGFAQILKRETSFSPRQLEQLQTIAKSGEHLLKLINDILDLSRIEAGRMPVNVSNFSLHMLLNDIESVFRSQSEEKGLQFFIERAPDLPDYVRADEAKLRHVLVNLLGNSIKYTRIGGITVRLCVLPVISSKNDHSNELTLKFEVEDTGSGIPEQDIPYVFDSLYTSTTGKASGGTSLGLVITSHLIKLMGGQISLESKSGSGVIVRFQIPVKLLGDTSEERFSGSRTVIGLETGTPLIRILIADDQKDNRELLCGILEPVGFHVKTVINGLEALEKVKNWAPHAVLMDMRMPIMDGYEAIRHIRSTEKGRTLPIIAIAANAFEDEENAVRETGVNKVLRKPVSQEDLLSALGELLKIRYIYEENPIDLQKNEENQPLTIEDVKKIPGPLAREMKSAVEEGEMEYLRQLIDELKKTTPLIAHKLLELAKQFDYEKLNQILRQTM